jgi:hypothetical protein
MTQSDVRNLVAKAAQSASDAYWDAATSDDAKGVLAGLVTGLNTLLTQLDQQDLASRIDDFNAAANLMKTLVLPGVKRLDASVGKVDRVEGTIKSALADAMKLSMATGFFNIPAL